MYVRKKVAFFKSVGLTYLQYTHTEPEKNKVPNWLTYRFKIRLVNFKSLNF